MARFGLVGPTYNSQSAAADPERCVNRYMERIEAEGKSALALYPCPGLKTFCTLGDAPGRRNGLFAFGGRLFAAAGASLYEVTAGKASNKLGAIANDGGPISWAGMAEPKQVVLSASGTLYLLDLATNALSTPAGLPEPVSQVETCKGYFLALLQATGKMQISGLLDGSSWPGLQFVLPSDIPDQPIAMKVDHNEVWLWSGTRGVAYYNSGSTSIFDPIGNSALLEYGNRAPASTVRADNTLFWIEASERGGGTARRLSGAIPARISNHAIEYRWSLYNTISDAVGWSYEDQGHAFVVWYFPSANATWVYDISTGMWHERAYWNTVAGAQFEAHLSCSHASAFGLHLVGDRRSGNIYEQSINYYDDAGDPLRWLRISPLVGVPGVWNYFNRLEVECEFGVGLQAGQGAKPTLALRYSDDNGKTWSNEYSRSLGTVGSFTSRALWNRLGRCWGTRRAFELSGSDPVPMRIIEGDLIAPPGYGPTERLTAQIGGRA